ncbi:hypothetical protein H0X06_02435 [Candidatus Dependentiae bacterium]|nr:hypothetical protein [Candidatus Dependentiae bacterium]
MEKTSTINSTVMERIEKYNTSRNYTIPVSILQISPSSDRSKIVTLDNYGYISLWDGQSGGLLEENLADYSCNKDEVFSIAFNERGTKVLVMASKQEIEKHEIVNSKALNAIRKHCANHGLLKKIQSSDGSKIVTLHTSGFISLWDGETGDLLEEHLAFYSNKKEILSIKFNNEGTKVLVATTKGVEEHEIINLQALKAIRNNNLSPLRMKSQNLNGTQIVTLDEQGYISLWDGKTGDPLDKFIAEYPTYCFNIYDSLSAEKDRVLSIGFNNEGTKILVTTSKKVEEYIIINPQALYKIYQYSDDYYYEKKSQSLDGSKIITFDHEGYISLWDGKTGEPLEIHFADYSNRSTTVLLIGFNDEGTQVLVTTWEKIEEHPIVQELFDYDKDTHELSCSLQ